MKQRSNNVLFILLLWLGVVDWAGGVPGQHAVVFIEKLSVMQPSMTRSRFVFHFSGHPAPYHQLHLTHPNRLVIDFHRTRALSVHWPVLHPMGPVLGIRSAAHPQGILRFVFDLKPTATCAVHSQATMASADELWVECVMGGRRLAAHTPKTHLSPPQPKPKPQPKPQPPRPLIVVIDPGHGGRDPGTTGLGGVREKVVVLAIAKRLSHDLNQHQGIRALLTRDRDFYLSLRRRLAIARRDRADLFLSIHADQYHNRRARGVSVFALSRLGASSEAARWVAQRENSAERVGAVDLVNKSNMLRSVLIDLSQTATIRASLWLGQQILHQVGQLASLRRSYVEQATFVVLKSPDIPSLLIETGFLSNPIEERHLRNPAYQERLAQAIAKAIVDSASKLRTV